MRSLLAGVATLLAAVGLALVTSGSALAGDTRVSLQPGAEPGCAPVSVWAQAEGGGDGIWALTPLAATSDSGAHTLIGHWTYAGGAAAKIADLGPLAGGRYRLQVFGPLATDTVLNVDCLRPPSPTTTAVLPLAATGGAGPVDAAGDTQPPVELVALHPDPSPGLSPITVALLGGLVLSVLMVGWSFARR
jgi:hypothetical protein